MNLIRCKKFSMKIAYFFFENSTKKRWPLHLLHEMSTVCQCVNAKVFLSFAHILIDVISDNKISILPIELSEAEINTQKKNGT